ncbi:MAG: FtsX-like permease family protein [Alistipes sp.]
MSLLNYLINRVNLEFFIARRMARNTTGQRPGVMVRIAAISVAVSVAVMILALAVIMGFKGEVTRRVVGFAAHTEIVDVRSVNSIASTPMLRTDALEQTIRAVDGFASMHPYVLKGGIIKTTDATQEMVLKGVDASYDWSFFTDFLVEGALPRVDEETRTKEVLISRMAANRLEVGVGDRIEMLFIEQNEAPRRDRFKITGIYASGMEEMDAAVMITDLRNVQRLSGWAADEVTGYEVNTTDFEHIDTFAHNLSAAILASELDETQNLAVNSVKELYPGIFDWLKTHNVNAIVIISIMLIVAFFNMASALLILVLERTRMIGLLKAMGMRNGAVQRIFLWRATFITLRGLAWGNGVGIGLCLLQQHLHLIKLSSEGYLLSEVPIALGWGWWAALNLGVIAVIVLLLLLPARVVATVNPSETIRYE